MSRFAIAPVSANANAKGSLNGGSATATSPSSSSCVSKDEKTDGEFDASVLESALGAIGAAAEGKMASGAAVLSSAMKLISSSFGQLRVLWDNVSEMIADIEDNRAKAFVEIVGKYDEVLHTSDTTAKQLKATCAERAFALLKLRKCLVVLKDPNASAGAKQQARQAINGLDFKNSFEEARVHDILQRITALRAMIEAELKAIGDDKARAKSKRNLCIALAILSGVAFALCIALPFVAPAIGGGIAAATAAVASVEAATAVSATVMVTAVTGAVVSAASVAVNAALAAKLDSLSDRLTTIGEMYVGADQKIAALQSDWKQFSSEVQVLRAALTTLDAGKGANGDLQLELLLDENIAKVQSTETENTELQKGVDALVATISSDLKYYKSLLELRKKLMLKTV